MRILPGPTKSNQVLAWSPDGRFVAAGGTGDGVTVWDVAAGTPGRRVLTGGHGGRTFQFCPRTGTLFVGFRGGLWLWDPATDAERLFPGSSGALHTAVSADGRAAVTCVYHSRTVALAGFAIGADGGAACTWERRDNRWDYDVAFTLLPGTGDLFGYGRPPRGTPQFQWMRAADGELLGAFRPSDRTDDRVTSWALAPDGARVAWLSDRSLQVRRLDSDALVSRPAAGNRRALAWAPDGRTLAVAAGGTVQLLEADTLAEVRAFDWGVGHVRAVAFAPDGLRAAVSGDRGRGWVAVFDLDV